MENFEEIDAGGMVNGRKTYYSISEVCGQTELEPHVLRYWESEFSQLRPKKNRAGNRAYRDKDIDVIKYIKRLLYEEQFTIPGAKKKLAEGYSPEPPAKAVPQPPEVEQINIDFHTQPQPDNGKFDVVKNELKEILELLTK